MNDISIDIKNLSLKELQELLKELKLYSSLRKQLGLRGKKLYDKVKTGKRNFEVEYFPSMTVDTVWDESKKIFKDVFGLDVKREEVLFSPKEKLIGGIRVFVDDEILDLSYDKIEKTLRK